MENFLKDTSNDKFDSLSSKRPRNTSKNINYSDDIKEGEEEEREEEEEENNDSHDSADEKGKKRILSKSTKKAKKIYTSETDSEDEDDLDQDDILEVNKETGRITKIYVENFMSHKKFELKFGKNLNFVTGPNGSGKSAIVAALQVCLGTRMIHTGRGNSLSGLIRQGSPGPAIVRVTLLNEGPDAYCSDVYGKRITIERVITKSSGATYKIMDQYNKCQSKEKRELDNILKTFSISCDNPCSVLTQELSKKFIQGNEADKYEFFLKATGLEMTRNEIGKVQVETEEIMGLVNSSESKLSGKLERLRAAKEEVDKFKQLDHLDKKIIECHAKIYWVDYYKTDDMISEILTKLEKRKEALNKASESLMEAEQEKHKIEDFDSIKNEITIKDDRLKELNIQLSEKNNEYKKISQKVPQLKQRLNATEGELKSTETRLQKVIKEIKHMREQALNAARDNERKVIQSIEEKKNNIDFYSARQRELNENLQNVTLERDRTNTQREDVTLQIRHFDNNLRKLKDEINSFSSNSQDRSSIFHNKMPEILRKIKASSFKGNVIGPVGMYVKLKEGFNEFGVAIESVIGGLMGTFIVSCDYDQNLLSNILRSCNAASVIKIHNGKLAPRYNNTSLNSISNGSSILDALLIENDTVFNFFIDKLNIDKVLLSNTEENVIKNFVVVSHAGRKELRDRINFAVLKDGSNIKFRDGNKAFEINRYPKSNVTFLVEDISGFINSKKEQFDFENQRFQGLKHEQGRIEEAVGGLNKEIKNIENEYKNTINLLRQENRFKENLETELEELQEASKIDTTPLEEEERELKLLIESINREILTFKSDYDAEVNEMRSKLAEKQRFQAQVDEVRQDLEDINHTLEKYIEYKNEIQKKINTCKGKVDIADREYKDAEKVLDEKKRLLVVKKDEAVKNTQNLLKDTWDGNNIDLDEKDTLDSLHKRIDSYQRKLQEAKHSAGLGQRSRDQAIANFKQASDEYQYHDREIKRLTSQLEDLVADCKLRKSEWKQQLLRSSTKVKLFFDAYLNKKGNSGTVDFDHKAKKLRLECQTDNFDANTQCKDVKQLSGGERSFTTLCLLLALGHVIDTPFRILDEYDVFMDENVRQNTLGQIKEHALDPINREKQFIIITPNNLRGIETNKETRIHRIKAPIREASYGLKQTTISYAEGE